MTEFVFPEKVKYVIESLEKNGFEAFAVGGCVRDTLMGRVPNDWDITTSALPQQIKQVFPHTVDTGIAHGTVTVLIGQDAFEVTTYRIDGAYADCRHPSSVTFTPSLQEDLRRRDFTVNAMACSPRRGLVDIYGGREDISRRIIRCVGNAEERFGEDALRIMRAVRFAAMLDFAIEEDTMRAGQALAGNLLHVSAERISAELTKLLTSDHPEHIETARKLSITGMILPEYDEIVNQSAGYVNEEGKTVSVGEHTVASLRLCRPDKVLRLTMLLHDMGKPGSALAGEDGSVRFSGHAQAGAKLAGEILRRLKMDRKTTESVCLLIREHTGLPPREPAPLRHMISRIGTDMFGLYLEVKEADILAGNPGKREERAALLEQTKALYREIIASGDALSVKALAVNGRDLIEAGFESGPRLGEMLQAMLEDVLDTPAHNTAEYLLAHAEELLEKSRERTEEI